MPRVRSPSLQYGECRRGAAGGETGGSPIDRVQDSVAIRSRFSTDFSSIATGTTGHVKPVSIVFGSIRPVAIVRDLGFGLTDRVEDPAVGVPEGRTVPEPDGPLDQAVGLNLGDRVPDLVLLQIRNVTQRLPVHVHVEGLAHCPSTVGRPELHRAFRTRRWPLGRTGLTRSGTTSPPERLYAEWPTRDRGTRNLLLVNLNVVPLGMRFPSGA